MTAVKIIYRYLQGTNYNGLVFNTSKKLVLDCYADAYFAGIWGHQNTQDYIFVSSRTGFVVTFDNCPILWVSKPQTNIALSTLYSEYVELSHYVRALLPLKSLIKEVIDNSVIDSDKLRFVSRSTVYEGNGGSKVVATSPGMTPTSKKISVKYHCFRQHIGE